MMQEIPRGLSKKVQHEPLDWNHPLKPGAVKFDPSRQTQLETEIAAIITRRDGNPEAAARRILHISRLTKALTLLEEHERLMRPRPESSDAR